MRKLHFGIVGVCLLCLTFLSSCIDNSYDLDNFSDDVFLRTEQVIPAGSSIIKASDLLREIDVEGVHVDADGLIYFQYDTISTINIEPFSFSLDKDTTRFPISKLFEGMTGYIPLMTGYIPLIKGTSKELPAELPIRIDEETGEGRIDTIYIKHADIDFIINTNVSGLLDHLSLDIAVPSNIPNGDYTWDQTHHKGTITVNNSKIDLTGSDILNFKCKITQTENASIYIDEDSYIEIICSVNSLRYEKIFGFFKSRNAQIEHTTLGIGLYDEKDVEYSLFVADPRIRVTASSNAGVPLTTTIESLKARKTTGSSVDAIFTNGTKSWSLHMEPSDIVGKEIMAMKDSFDSKNGCIDKLINSTPDSIDLETGFFINGEKTSADQNPYFLLDSTYVKLGISAFIPCWMNKGSFIVLRDTIEDVDIYEDVNDYEKDDYEIESAEIYIEINNRMPLHANIDVSFLEEDSLASNYTDSIIVYKEIQNKKLKQNITVDAAPVSPQTHLVNGTKSTRKVIEVDKSMVKDIKRIKRIQLIYNVRVPDASESVKVTGSNTIETKAYVHAKGNYSSKKDK